MQRFTTYISDCNDGKKQKALGTRVRSAHACVRVVYNTPGGGSHDKMASQKKMNDIDRNRRGQTHNFVNLELAKSRVGEEICADFRRFFSLCPHIDTYSDRGGA